MTYQLKLFNTKTQKKEVFKPKDANLVKLYTCGPTVYDYAHIGNLRTYIFEDLLKRVLLYQKRGVRHIMNITDVDDKTIRGALKQKTKLTDFTKKYELAFFEDLNTLNIIPADVYPRATDHINEMIDIIEKLIKDEVAYIGSDQSVYFSISKYPDYGKLSHLNLSELKTGASERIEADEYDKENITDFVLWKSYQKERDGHIFWDSPFGKGRPGWHLECSAMAMKYLGEELDLHMGGVDNMFPHHENETAQSECYSHKEFCHFWVHVEHLMVDGKKMSKSLGNFFTLRDLLKKGFEGRHVRMLLMQTHYKTQLNFTLEGLNGAKSAIDRIQNFILRLQSITQKDSKSSEASKLLEKMVQKFDSALFDDINISVALSSIFDLIREIYPLIDQEALSKKQADSILKTLQSCNAVLGILHFEETTIPKELEEALQKREEARQSKNWALADELRDMIFDKGYIIEDGASGATLKKK